MLLSIITVVKNGQNLIEKTMRSVDSQNANDYEWIVWDGGSTDRTPEIVERYQHKNYRMKLYIRQDEGIYDAMNQSVALATGDYVLFLNAGDTFYDSTTVTQILHEIEDCTFDICYGNRFDEVHGTTNYPARITGMFFFREKIISHQAIIARKNCLLEYPFSLTYTYGADRDWMIHSLFAGKQFHLLPLTVVSYDLTGLTSRPENAWAVWTESVQILKKYYTPMIALLLYPKHILLVIIPKFICKLFKH